MMDENTRDDELLSLCYASAFESIEEAHRELLQCLKEHIPFALWMVTTLEDDDWVVVHSLENIYGAKRGKLFSWSDTYCKHMVRGDGPFFAEDAQKIGVYQAAPINHQVGLPIGAYIGLPLWKENGELSGTLCALDPSPQPPLTYAQKFLVCTVARALSTLQISYSDAEDSRREAERLKYVAETDLLTGLANRRGWDWALQDQEKALHRITQNSAIIMIDLDDLKLINDSGGHEAGDVHLRAAGALIRGLFRDKDVVARIGGDEFAVLVPNTSKREALQMEERLRQALAQAQIRASVGSALRLAYDSMEEALAAADGAMYADKALRKAGRTSSAGLL